jgi:tetratricopeptide (TPR) repeat protein
LAHADHGRLDEAVADFDAVIRLAPGSAEGHYFRGLVHADRGDRDRAVADFGEAIRLDPQLARAYWNRGLAHLARRDYERAIADYTEVIRINPDDPAGYNQRAVCRCLKGERAEALADHEEALRRDPENPATHNYLAWLLATSPEDGIRDGPRALEYATRACEQTEWQNAAFLDTLAAAYAECGRFDEAVRWEGKALELVSEAGKADYRSRLELYQAGRPYREEPPPVPSDTGPSSEAPPPTNLPPGETPAQ